ncbi:MAG: hypothetical protein JO314_00605 [Acidobacteria bacterium]|nr:hypothetical protein [Acidobacteriota bacterium]
MKVRFFLLITVLAITAFAAGCSLLQGSIIGPTDTATVIAKTAQIRTSYSVVAADLLEVKRGDTLDVIDQVEFEKVPWFRVRARDEAQTEGWIEAQNVITSGTLQKSKELASQFQDQPPQAAGLIRSASNLRAQPDMSPENVLFKLPNGSRFEIMQWKFVPKQDAPDVDDAPKGQQKAGQKVEPKSSDDDDDEPPRLDEKYDMWYLVRLDPSVSPAPAGWLFGRQVELQVPSDISFFQQNDRKFITWQRLDSDAANKVGAGDKSLAPGSWVILARDPYSKPTDGAEPDFDYILVLAFDKYDQNYYTVWRTTNHKQVWGRLPPKVEGQGDNKTFTVTLRNPQSGAFEEKRFVVFKDKTRLRVTPPEDIGQYETSEDDE